MAKAIGVKVDAEGRTIVVYAGKRARGSKTFGVKGARVVSQHARVGSGARYLYR
jgi:membrane-bound inhibitor of C-type lysozyme